MTTQTEKTALVFVGTYTERLSHVDGKGVGLEICRLDMTKGQLRRVSQLTEQTNPTYLALHPRQPWLYLANETAPGHITACRFDAETGAVQVLNVQSSHGTSPCHIAVHENGQWLIAANYGSGTVAVFPILADGQLGEATSVIQHEGSSSSNSARQEAAHAHCVLIDPTSDRVFVADLGMDQVLVYALDGASGALSAQAAIPIKAGAGPRHLALHPGNQWLFVINELDSTINVFAYDSALGTFTEKQSISTLPTEYQAANHPAALHVHPSGRFVYGSNRGHDSIAIFGFDESSGSLHSIGHVSTRGQAPRDFVIDPTGSYLLAANQNSDSVVSFRINQDTGMLEDLGHKLEIATPVCLKVSTLASG